MDERMMRRAPWVPWAIASLVLVLVAIVAYSAGADSNVPAGDGGRWHFHLGGIFPLFFLLWMFGAFRWMAWGCFRPWRYGYGPGWHHMDREDWEAWHRREHERMHDERGRGESQSGPSSSSR